MLIRPLDAEQLAPGGLAPIPVADYSREPFIPQPHGQSIVRQPLLDQVHNVFAGEDLGDSHELQRRLTRRLSSSV